MSDHDPRVRELTYRLMEMAPDAPPFPEEVMMTVPETKQRPPMLVWATAAVAVVLLVGLPLFLFRSGDGTTDPATTIAAGPTTTVQEPTTTVPEATTTAPPSGEIHRDEVAIYLFAEDMPTELGDPPLVPVPGWEDYQDRREPEPGERAVHALEALFSATPSVEFSTSIPVGVSLVSAGVNPEDPDGIFVDLSQEFESGGGTMAMTTRLAQVVFTATQFDGVDSVLFMIDGEVVEVFSGEGLVLDGPQTRADYVDILPLIFLDSPAMNSNAPSPAHISGIANVFEATVMYEIVDGAGSLLVSGFTTASCGTGCWGDFSVDVPYDVPQETPGEIVVYEESAKDGSRINELRFPVTLVPGNDGVTPSTTIPPTTVPSDDVSTTSLPGEAFDIGPAAGDVVAVVGVAHDDVLNVRIAPGVGQEPFVFLDPLADDVVATGRHRLLESSIWSEVTAEGFTGWVNSRYVGYLGSVDDLTSQIVASLGGIPEAETMVDLGTVVAESFESDEGGFRWEISVAPRVADLGEITIDVLGLADDSQRGYRLHIFGQPTTGGEGFSLMSVEATAICGRGVTDDGLCV